MRQAAASIDPQKRKAQVIKQGSEMDESKNNSRRDFFLKSAALGASAVIAGSSDLLAQKSSEAETSSRYGNGPYPTEGMAGYSETDPLKPLKFQRRALGPKDVAIKIQFCGVCHSDIHTIHGDWGKIQYPQVVGHELAGEVVAAGSSVSRFDVGSRVGVGTMVNSCRHCPECLRGAENYCENGNTQTYGSKDRDGSITQGGYACKKSRVSTGLLASRNVRDTFLLPDKVQSHPECTHIQQVRYGSSVCNLQC
jgi:uncharacterized zinc-type alcohol dehydrogenase-like protein